MPSRQLNNLSETMLFYWVQLTKVTRQMIVYSHGYSRVDGIPYYFNGERLVKDHAIEGNY